MNFRENDFCGSLQPDGQTGITKLIFAFRNFTNVSRNVNIDSPTSRGGQKITGNILASLCLPLRQLCQCLTLASRAYVHKFQNINSILFF